MSTSEGFCNGSYGSGEQKVIQKIASDLVQSQVPSWLGRSRGSPLEAESSALQRREVGMHLSWGWSLDVLTDVDGGHTQEADGSC